MGQSTTVPPPSTNTTTWEALLAEHLPRGAKKILPMAAPPKAPPWPAPIKPDTHTPTTGAAQQPQHPRSQNDGDPTSHLIDTSRKRGGNSEVNLSFKRMASPLAKRAVLCNTPEKMKQHVGNTAVTWLLDNMDRSTDKGLNE
jgi:hypothetical protein